MGNYPSIKIADVFEEMDTTNIPGILSIAQKHNIDAIVTTGTDVAVPAIGAVVDELQLKGTGYKAALKSTNKVLMKKAFEKNAVPTAKFVIVNDFSEALVAAQTIEYPLIVKAVGSSGSRGITKVNNLSALKEAWDRAIEASRSSTILIEQFLDGIEYGAQAIIKGNEVLEVFCHNDTVTSPPYLVPIGHSMPVKFDPIINKKTIADIRKAVSALEIRDTITNVDLMLVNGEPMIIEIGARM